MADIKIKQSSKNGDYSAETTVEVTGMEYGADDLAKAVLERLGQGDAKSEPAAGGLYIEGEAGKEFVVSQVENANANGLCRLRRVRGGYISPDLMKQHRDEGRLDEIISPFDEIDIPLDTGGTVTVVCGYSDPNTARFVLKDCWDEAVMNDEPTNKTGYFKSKGRAHVLVDILPHIAQEWRALFKPRQMVEEISGERVEYADLMWLPSATDVFGPSEDGYWKDLDDSFQLPIFRRERDRVKECGGEGTYPYWLRSVSAAYTHHFRVVYTSGYSSNYTALISLGFAPGFDI